MSTDYTDRTTKWIKRGKDEKVGEYQENTEVHSIQLMILSPQWEAGMDMCSKVHKLFKYAKIMSGTDPGGGWGG